MNQHKFAFRVGVLVLLIAVMAGVFSVRLHNVQITQAAEQDPTPSGSVTYHTRVTAARGEILDRNGNVLVGNRASYNLVIVREVLMSADAPNENLRRLVDLCSELGLEYTDHFPVTQEKPYAYVDSGSSLWDGYFRTFLTERGWDTDVSAPQLIRWLKEIYHLPADWTEEECRRVISLRYELDLRRYIGTLDTYVLMTDVDALSLAAITELNIPGLNVETSRVRQYNTTLAAHILGTIGKMDGTDWETYESKGYAMDAYIGKDGLEQAFEEELHGSDGTRVTTITADGNILEEHYAVDPVAGNNIETTIDLGLQKVAEESLAAKILGLRENGVGVSGNGKDAEGGAVVVMKVKTARCWPARATRPMTFPPIIRTITSWLPIPTSRSTTARSACRIRPARPIRWSRPSPPSTAGPSAAGRRSKMRASTPALRTQAICRAVCSTPRRARRTVSSMS